MESQNRLSIDERNDAITTDVTLQEAAEFLGVHYMTAYRYVRLGTLQAHKSGNVWRVRREDLDMFRAAVPAAGVARPPAPWAERLESRLVAGDGGGAWGVVEAALASGGDPRSIYLDVITPAMVSIGERWEKGELDIAVEHRASGVAYRLVGRLGPRFTRRGRTLGTVLVGAPAGEHHALPVSMAADLIRLEGYEVSDLGADTPPASFATAAAGLDRLVAVGISVTSPMNLGSARDTIVLLRDQLNNVPIMIGGSAVQSDDMRLDLGADLWVRDPAELPVYLAQAMAIARA
jgi:MerR family transcriptional regulator, light-induced transcriptional regulator